MRLRRSACGAILTALALVGCGLTDEIVEEPGSGEVAIGPQQTLEIETWNGRVEVKTCDEPKVRAQWVKRGAGPTKDEARADLAKIEVVLSTTPGGARLVARRIDASTSGSSGASLTACVPSGTRVVAKTSNGRVSVRTGSTVSATTSNGAVEVQGAQGAVTAHTDNGSVTVKGTDLVLDAETSNGAVHVDGSLAAGKHRIRTSNGRVELSLPADARFALHASTSNGSITSDFALTPPLESRTHSVDAATGPGAPAKVSITTSNGAIEVRKRP